MKAMSACPVSMFWIADAAAGARHVVERRCRRALKKPLSGSASRLVISLIGWLQPATVTLSQRLGGRR